MKAFLPHLFCAAATHALSRWRLTASALLLCTVALPAAAQTPVQDGSAATSAGAEASSANANPATTTPATATTDPLVEKGRLLAIAADCTACHTVKGGKPFAGGLAVDTPLGAIYATNITPSKTAGIGSYSEAEFARALRQGIRKDGRHLYPAMPYTAYTQITNEDNQALYAYFQQAVKPVDQAAPATALPFPFNLRWSMAAWNLLFFKDQRFVPEPRKSPEWNRGAYLANALAHCSTCHTPRNELMAEKSRLSLSGAALGPWYAPNITPDVETGIGSWSQDEIVAYLGTGRAAGKAQAAGPMAEAIEHSLQYLPEADLRAMAVFLKDRPAIRNGAVNTAHSAARTPPGSIEPALRGMAPSNDTRPITSGEQLYSGYCASCHQATGAGSLDQAYPSLLSNSATSGRHPANLVAAILYGVDRKVGSTHVFMPSFDEKSYVDPLSDEQVAAIANFVLSRWGGSDAQVTPAFVAQTRTGGPRPLLARLQPYMAPAMAVGALIVVLLVLWIVRRRRPKTKPLAV